jgi:dTDP-4-amino-4,6-dideoxygalactose transaminase
MANATLLRGRLADVKELHFQIVPEEAAVHTNYLLLGRVDGNRDRFQKKLTAAGFPCTPFYPHTLYQNPLYLQKNNCRVMPCPNSEARIGDAFWIPHRALLGDEADTEALALAIRAAATDSR